jgi:hypothetical protein
MELQPPATKTIDLEGRLVKYGVRKAIQDPTDRSLYAVQELNKAIKSGEIFVAMKCHAEPLITTFWS